MKNRIKKSIAVGALVCAVAVPLFGFTGVHSYDYALQPNVINCNALYANADASKCYDYAKNHYTSNRKDYTACGLVVRAQMSYQDPNETLIQLQPTQQQVGTSSEINVNATVIMPTGAAAIINKGDYVAISGCKLDMGFKSLVYTKHNLTANFVFHAPNGKIINHLYDKNSSGKYTKY